MQKTVPETSAARTLIGTLALDVGLPVAAYFVADVVARAATRRS